MKLLSRLGEGRMPRLYMWSKFHACNGYVMWLVWLIPPKLLGKLWKQYAASLKVFILICLSLSLLHVLTHFIPQIGLRSRRYDNKHNPPPKKKNLKRKKWNGIQNHHAFPPPLCLVWLPPPYNFNTPAVLTEAKPTFEQREWPYVGGHVMGAKSMTEAFRKYPFWYCKRNTPIPHGNFI